MLESERKKVRALYVFEIVLAGYLLGCLAVQTWLVWLR
jgi:hypothetical protein